MSNSTQAQYLNSKVTTASQPELQLMLFDGALRFGAKARKAWAETMDHVETERYLGRTLDILEAIVMGVSGSDQEIAKQLEEQYAFLFREIAASRINNDLKRFDKAMTLLAYERETWKMACDKLAAETAAIASAKRKVPAPHAKTSVSAESFSFQA